jgi:hypothetical protein
VPPLIPCRSSPRYKYLLRTVAAGDGDRSLSTPLTRYYSEEGSPPGRWLGAGVDALGGLIVEGDQVSESQLWAVSTELVRHRQTNAR